MSDSEPHQSRMTRTVRFVPHRTLRTTLPNYRTLPRCKMFAVGERDLAKAGKSGPDTPPNDGTRTWVDKATGEAHQVPRGIDPGWDYAPGASQVERMRREIARKVETLPKAIGDRLAKAVETIPPKAPPVSLALQLPKSGALAKPLLEALATIDALHDDGALPMIPVKSTAAKSYFGQYTRRTSDGAALAISVSRSSPWPELTLAHEIGHFIDHQAIGTIGKFSYTDPIWDEFLQAAGNSEAIKALVALPSDKYRDYYLRTWEIWARAYAQWIAQKSGRTDMLAALDKIRGDTDPVFRRSQWGEQDFAPIAAAIEAMFRKLGWL